MNSTLLKSTFATALVAILGALLPLIASASSVTVAPGTVEGPAGGKVKIPIEVEDAIKLGAIQMELHYDPKVLEYYGTREGTFEEEVTTDIAVREPGRLFLLSSTGARETVSDDGVLSYVVFRVKGSEGASSPLALEAVEAVYDERPDMESLEMLVRTKAGHFTVNGVAPPLWPWIAGGGALLALMIGLAIARKARRHRHHHHPSSSVGSATTTFPCHECSASITEGSKFCPECGTPAKPKPDSISTSCAQCNADLEADSRFCRECGHPTGKPTLKVTV